MFKIECKNLFKSKKHNVAYVANCPKSKAEPVTYTADINLAHSFRSMNVAKNIRDDVLEVCESATVLKL